MELLLGNWMLHVTTTPEPLTPYTHMSNNQAGIKAPTGNW